MNINTRQALAIERTSDGLRAFFGKIYNYMAGSLVLSALSAYISTKEPLLNLLYKISDGKLTFSVLGWLIVVAPFLLILMIQSAANQLNPAKTTMLFWIFSVLMGLSMGSIFLTYTTASIFQTFLITAASFIGLSIWGNITKRDLSGLGAFLFMGLIGIILASVVNIFITSSMISFVVSVLGVFIFAGLIVYDTNRLKQMYASVSVEQRDVLAVTGALSLYLNFINLFQFLLSFGGDRR
ncbi:MAG: Bax inhibitor-1/YccA family protein [Alphaproteobacteria bacterium]|nr:Bax inhibitor-1/YccA family protein [Alphaproteobacteria bacterium]